jgi:hydroxymethylpyrimidine kinase/phosphomethylpyrimidine kinase
MRKQRQLSVALTIAGSDSGGGAGIQTDLKTFAAFGVHGTSAITCVTAQNPERVVSVQAIRPEIVRDQIEAVFAELTPRALKTGMLFSARIIRTIALLCQKHQVPIVVDPVMTSTSGARLIETVAIKALQRELIPLATLVTPNLDEAEILIDRKITSVDDLRMAARRIRDRYGCAALVKGGHLRGVDEAIDFFWDGRTELLLSAPFIRNVHTHGTGCTYSAAITACLAKGFKLGSAVTQAKEYITQAIAQRLNVAGFAVLNNFCIR